MLRRLIFFVLLVAAGFVPYAAMNKDWQTRLQSAWANLWSSPPGASAEAGVLARFSRSLQSLFAGGAPKTIGNGSLIPNTPMVPLTGERVDDLAQIIRFDVNPDWVMARWGRVSTVLSEPGLEGFRVAVVTGPNVEDLAGSLTYFFDQQRTVQRVTFRGSTGDDRRVVELVQRVYSFKRDPSVVSQQYTARWSGKINSVLRLTNPPVVRAGIPNSRIDVLLEINRPHSPYGLSIEMQQILTTDSRYSSR